MYNNMSSFQQIIGTFMGRDALLFSILALKLETSDTVLLPAYLCGEVMKPFLGKTRIKFYHLGESLFIDPDEIRQKIDKNNIKVLLIINYFGFLQPFRKELKEICNNKGVVIIEDCAHSFLTKGSGDTGDISIFSFRKILPVTDGGGLQFKGFKEEFKPNYYPEIISNTLSVMIMVKSFLNIRSDILSRAELSSFIKKRSSNTLASKFAMNKTLPMSVFSKNKIPRISTNYIFEERRKNFNYWINLSKETSGIIPIFNFLPEGVCPLGFPIKVHNRDLHKTRLIKKGIYLEIHWHLPENIGNEFYECYQLSKQILTLPVTPSLSKNVRTEIEQELFLNS